MTDLPPNFDFHKFLNDGIKDEFSPILEKIVEVKFKKNRTKNLDVLIDNFFKEKERKSVSAS